MDALILIVSILLLALPFVALFFLIRRRQESKQTKGAFPDVDSSYEGPPVIPPG
jgi:hypothetical protein